MIVLIYVNPCHRWKKVGYIILEHLCIDTETLCLHFSLMCCQTSDWNVGENLGEKTFASVILGFQMLLNLKKEEENNFI